MGLPPIGDGIGQPVTLTDDEEISLIESLPPEILNVIFSQSGFSCVSLAQTNYSFRQQVLSTPHLKIHYLADRFLALGFQTAEALPWSQERSLLMTEAALFLAPWNQAKAVKALNKTVMATEAMKPTISTKKPCGTKAAVLADIAVSSLPLGQAFAEEILEKAKVEAMQNNTPLKRALALSLIVEKAGSIDPSMQKQMAELALHEIANEQVPADILKPIFGTLVQYEPVKVMKVIGLYQDAATRAILLEHTLQKVPQEAFSDILSLALSIATGLSNEDGDGGHFEGDSIPGQDDLIGQIVTYLAPLEPAKAIAIAETEGTDHDYLISCVAPAIASTAFDLSLELAKSITHPATRLKTLRSVLMTLASENHLKACVVAMQLNNEQINHDLTMAIIRSEANNDPDLALARADDVTDPILRENVFICLFDQWTEAKNPIVFSHLTELKSWMNKSRQALKIIKAFPTLGETDLKAMLDMVNTPLERIEAKIIAATRMEHLNPSLSTTYALAAMTDIFSIPPQSSTMLDPLHDIIGNFARLQPEETGKILAEAKAKKYHEKVVTYLLLFLAKDQPAEALNHMKNLVTSPELRQEILVEVAKSIARSGKPQDVVLIDSLFGLIENEAASLSKVKLYLSIAEALTKITPISTS